MIQIYIIISIIYYNHGSRNRVIHGSNRTIRVDLEKKRLESIVESHLNRIDSSLKLKKLIDFGDSQSEIDNSQYSVIVSFAKTGRAD